ncbi:hypothetical protein CVT25_001657 [Psilocybe cyanescens]|uniref:Uncharacterized protein n=1 Tax=Psilocybe cyanescens TaxID=93625 RepID=A0A409XHH5_PSICY|nr:hypothetical protein CVT25_001657 [Psilocybe cyanescens]
MIVGRWKWQDDGWGKPTAPSFHCGRFMLQRVFVKTLERCTSYGQSWKLLRAECHDSWVRAAEASISDLGIGFLNFSWVRYSLIRLSNYLGSCKTCETHSEDDILAQILAITDSSEDDQEDSTSEASRPVRPKMWNTRCTPKENPATETRRAPAVFHVQDDDYGSSPIKPRNIIPTEKNIWVFGGGAGQVLPDCWMFWKDQGFRSHPSFFRTLPLDSTEAKSQVFEVPFPKSTKLEEFEPENSNDEKTLALSAQSFIDEAGPQSGTEASRRVFLLGREREKGTSQNQDKYLILDLEKDNICLPIENVEISVDLDSLIWVTSIANFKACAIHLNLTPVYQKKAAFSTHNFVYVNLVSPPRNQDELDHPQSRLLQDVRLSRIPHLRFGFCGEAERRINFYVFFPRMIHQNEKTHRYATLLPMPVQELWYDSVIIPSCNLAFKGIPGFAEYIPSNLADLWNRAGDKKAQTHLICEPQIDRLMVAIEHLIKDDPGLLSCFGSCFIVADGRGMKLATKQCVHPMRAEASSSMDFNLVKDMFSDLNWDQMLDPRLGGLYLDRGISIHSNYKEHLVALWRLQSLRDSFDALGTKKGVVHHFSTLASYGGIKAEMQEKFKEETNLVSRICYCLAFQLVRNPGLDEYLCRDEDIIHRSKRFIGACKKWTEQLRSGITRSFGVRDEIRGLAGTILTHLPGAIEQAKTWLRSNPILWIKSSTFFTFLERRFTELCLLHERCFNFRLLNYRTMSLVIGHLLHHSLVTPIIKNMPITAVFRELRFEEVMMGWGIFLLHDLDWKKMKLLGVPDEDSAGLVNAYKLPFKQATLKKEVPLLKLCPQAISKDYPWGEMVTDSRLKELLQTVPSQFLKTPSPQLPGDLTHPDSALIFMAFTTQIWLLLSHQFNFVPDAPPRNLEEATAIWTLVNMQKLFGDISVLPTYDGVEQELETGRPGNIIFRRRRKFFFPEPDRLDESPLKPFTTHNAYYLHTYHAILATQTKQQVEKLNHDLDVIFDTLQCLPASVYDRKRDLIWKTREGKLEFVVNAIYYRVKGILYEKENPVARRGQLNAPALQKKLHEHL